MSSAIDFGSYERLMKSGEVSIYRIGMSDEYLPFLDLFSFCIEVVQNMTWSNFVDPWVALYNPSSSPIASR